MFIVYEFFNMNSVIFQVVEGFVTATNNYYPQYMRELLGMAHGANIPFHEVYINTLK